MRCEEVMELMQRHLDHDLNDEEAKRMREHADGCADCSDMLRRLELLNEDLENLPKVTPAFSIVDSILPKLHEIDSAAAEDSQAAARQEPASEPEPSVVPLRRSRRTFRTPAWTAGGIAAAALLLGVMIFNGLPETFKNQASRSMEEASNSGEAMLFADDSAGDAPAAQESAASEEAVSTEEAPAVESAGAQEKQSANEAQGPAVDPDTPVSNTEKSVPEADRGVNNNRAQVATVPDRINEPDERVSNTEGAASGQDAAPEPQPGTESIPGDAGYGIAAMPDEPVGTPESEPVPEAALEDGVENRNKGFAAHEPTPYHTMALANEDGSLNAIEHRQEDGTFVVAVATMDGALVFTSEHVWPSDTALRFNEWSGDIVSYTVTTPDGESTYAIDVSAGTEDEVVR